MALVLTRNCFPFSWKPAVTSISFIEYVVPELCEKLCFGFLVCVFVTKFYFFSFKGELRFLDLYFKAYSQYGNQGSSHVKI